MKKATLDGDTLWRLSIKLQADGEKTSEATARVRFVDYRNYEPPQGQIFVEDDYNGLVQVNEKGYCKVLWTLSEDKENRKDGLWVWGLFEEPKYPFLYFSLGKSVKDACDCNIHIHHVYLIYLFHAIS
jgi:hypothetical protein